MYLYYRKYHAIIIMWEKYSLTDMSAILPIVNVLLILIRKQCAKTYRKHKVGKKAIYRSKNFKCYILYKAFCRRQTKNYIFIKINKRFV